MPIILLSDINYGAKLLALKSVIIPNTVTSIGDYAFCSTGLTSIDIPEGVTSIGSRAFLRCASLKSEYHIDYRHCQSKT